MRRRHDVDRQRAFTTPHPFACADEREGKHSPEDDACRRADQSRFDGIVDEEDAPNGECCTSTHTAQRVPTRSSKLGAEEAAAAGSGSIGVIGTDVGGGGASIGGGSSCTRARRAAARPLRSAVEGKRHRVAVTAASA